VYKFTKTKNNLGIQKLTDIFTAIATLMKHLLILILAVNLFFFFSCKKSDEPSAPGSQLGVSPASLTIKGNAESIDSFTINYNGNWILSINPSTADWLKVSSTSGNGNKKIYVSAQKTNTSGTNRTATIVATSVSDVAQNANITVTQRPYEFTSWHNVYGGTQSDVFEGVVRTPDGGFIAIGYAESNDGDVSVNRGDRDFWVVKVNAEGIKLWEKSFGGSGKEEGYEIIAATDGGYLIAGNTSSQDGDVTGVHGLSDVWLIKIDENGNLVWQKTYGGSGSDGALSIIKTSQGYLIAGYTSSPDGDVTGYHATPGSNAGDVWLISIDQSGNIVWQKAFGGSNQEAAFSSVATSDGGNIVVGYTNTSTGDGDVSKYYGRMDMWVFKINASGSLVWEKTFGGINIDLAANLVATPDGGFIISGYLSSSDGWPGNQDAGIIKMDGSGNIIWQKNFGGSKEDGGWSISPASDGGYIVAGFASSTDGNVSGQHGKTDAWIIKLTSQGDLMWQKTFGGSDLDLLTSIVSIGNDEYVVTGNTLSSDNDIVGQHGNYDAWLFTFKDQ